MYFAVMPLALAATSVYATILSSVSSLTEVVSTPQGLTSDGKTLDLPGNNTLARRDVIVTYYLTSLIGGGGGSYYEDHFKDNTNGQHYPNWSYGAAALVKRLTVWWKNDWVGLHGIQVTYQDGTQGPIHGRPDGNQDSIVIKPGVTVTELTVWGNGQGSRTGRIRIKLSDGTSWAKGRNDDGPGYNQDITGTSGLLTGIYGRSGDGIDCLGFTFIMPVSNQRVTNMNFNDNVIGTNTNVDTVSYKTYNFENDGDITQTGQSASDSFTWTTTQSWTNQLSLELGISYSIKVGIPSIAEETVGATWKTTFTTSTSQSTSSSETFTSNPKCDVPAHSTCRVDVLMTKGTLSQLAYTADVQINVNGWDGWYFQEQGVFNTVSYGAVNQVNTITKNKPH